MKNANDLLDEVGQRKLWCMARHLASKLAYHEDPDEITHDLIQAAWVKLLELKTRKYIWRDLEYAMLEEISRWNYQCKRGRGKNRVLRYKHSLRDYVKVWNRPIRIEQVLV